MFRNELCPVDLYTVELPSGKIDNFMDLKIPAKANSGGKEISFSAPDDCDLFSRSYLTKQRLTNNGLSLMLGSGNCDDAYTRSFYGMYRVPNFVRVACFIKLFSPGQSIEVRPTTSVEQIALESALRVVKDKKKSDKIKSSLKSFKIKEESSLFPFVFSIYPFYEKDLVPDYRIFAVGVGWDPTKNKWRDKTVFEVINQTKNFAVTVNYEIDEDGLISSKLSVEDRSRQSETRKKEILGVI